MLDRQLRSFSDVSLQLIKTRDASFTRKNVLNERNNRLLLLVLLFKLLDFFNDFVMLMLKLLHKTLDSLIFDLVTDSYLFKC